MKVKEFISKLKGHESHYGRAKSRRIYLSSEYNIAVLWKIFNNNTEEKFNVNYKYFSRVFNNHFNIGFGSPATDVCGYCVRTLTQISICKEPREKQKLKTELQVHKVRAKNFHKLMKEQPADTTSYCFDLQQVQPLPKVPIQDAFYSQQVSFYCLCITENTDIKNPVFYTWLETEAKRGAAEVCSALRHFLETANFTATTKKLRLFADGCSGQNKNCHVMHMLMLWLNKDAPKMIQSIEVIFPVRGHSYLPADRVFGRAEKLIRAHSTIKTREKYHEIVYSKIGRVRTLGTDWCLYDIKSALTSLKKPTGLQSAKRVIIKRSIKTDCILIKLEMLYRNDDPTKKLETLLKPGKRINQIELPKLTIGKKIKQKKLKSLEKLLISLSGENWPEDPELTWLQPIFTNGAIQGTNSQNPVSENDEQGSDTEMCDCNTNDELTII